MNDGPSREEFRAFSERVYQTMDAGFAGTHTRLDTLNGRVLKGEVADAELRARTTNVEKELFARPRRRTEDRDDEGTEKKKPPMFTKREAALVAGGFAIIATLLKIALVAGEFAFELVKTAVVRR